MSSAATSVRLVRELLEVDPRAERRGHVAEWSLVALVVVMLGSVAVPLVSHAVQASTAQAQ